MPGIGGNLRSTLRWAAAAFTGLVLSERAAAWPSATNSPASFRNEVMAVLAKGGCSSGTCHGNRNGKGGFKLSLRGQDPNADYQALLADVAGRRVDRMVPEESLLLLKPTTQVPHEGRQRFITNSVEYEILRRWIAEGTRDDQETAPGLVALDVTPREQFVVSPNDTVQIRATAKFADGSSRDVTSLAVYEPVVPIVEVSHDGEVRARQHGETTVLVRYLDRQEPVSLAFLPVRATFLGSSPATNNFIDEHIFARLKKLRLNTAELCSDTVFLRRACLDLIGLLPTATEARTFLADSRPDKRRRLITELLERREFAEFWALQWADLFRCEERALDRKGVQAFQQWLVMRIADHTPLDRFARELLTARGSTYANPAANWFRSHRTPVERAEAIAQVFLGTRLQCAQCHNHPYERWTQADYHDWTALFARLDYKVVQNFRRDPNDKHEFIGEQLVYVASRGEHQNPRTGTPAQPRILGATVPLSVDTADPLAVVAEWLTRPDARLFARAQANRVWFHLMGRGLVDPLDDFRTTNPASHPALLEALAAELTASGFDLRHLIQVIMESRTYQLASEPTPGSEEDLSNYSHNIVRRLMAEQLLDCQSEVAGVALEFAGWPAGTRAAQLPGTSAQLRRGRKPTGDLDRYLQTFGKPPRQLTTECERSCEPTMGQVFELVSGPALQQLIAHPDNRLSQLLESKKSPGEIVDELYWTALSRPPESEEREQMVAYVGAAGKSRAAFEDILWSLLNAKELVLRH